MVSHCDRAPALTYLCTSSQRGLKTEKDMPRGLLHQLRRETDAGVGYLRRL